MQTTNQLPAHSKATEQDSFITLRKSFSQLKINSQEIDRIAVCFQQLLFLRNETIEQYPHIDQWFEYFSTNGYNAGQIIEMLELAKELPVYKKPLGLGDVITKYQKTREESIGIKYVEFENALRKMLETDRNLINKVSLEITGTPFMSNRERKYFKEYLAFISARIEDETLACQTARRVKISELLEKSDSLFEADRLIVYDRLVFVRSLLLELDETQRQPLRVLRKKLELLEKEYTGYFKGDSKTYTQELGACALLAYQIILGYDHNVPESIQQIKNTLAKYWIIKPEFKKEED